MLSNFNLLELNSALGCVLRHDLADLILLGIGEEGLAPMILLGIGVVVVFEYCWVHFECFEAGLPSKEHQQRSHAFFPIAYKPIFLEFNCDALKPVYMVVGEDL